jgi:hypothetical protein
MTARELLAAVRAAQGIPSNYALAKLLDVRERDLSRWNNGHNVPNDPIVVRLAELAGLDPAQVLPAIAAQRTTDTALRSVWERSALLAARGSGLAVAVLASVALNSEARAAGISPIFDGTPGLYIMSTRLALFLARLGHQVRRVVLGETDWPLACR